MTAPCVELFPSSLFTAAVILQTSPYVRAILIPTIFVLVVLALLIYFIWLVKENQKRNPVADLNREFRAGRDILLALAEKKKAERETSEKQAREDARIKEEIAELSVEIGDYIGHPCPQCLQDIEYEMDVIVIVDANECVHLSCFREYLIYNPDAKSEYLYLFPEDRYVSFDDYVSGESP